MKKLIIGALFATAFTLPAFAALKQSEKAPDFKARASLDGKEFDFSLADALKKGPVVVYFYPAAYTPGCSAEAHAFAETKDKFDTQGATIIGVSQDTIERLKEFSADPAYCAGKFPVASDSKGDIAKAYNLSVRVREDGSKDMKGRDLSGRNSTERTTFVIDKDHKIVATLSSADDGIKASDHADKSLAVVASMKK